MSRRGSLRCLRAGVGANRLPKGGSIRAAGAVRAPGRDAPLGPARRTSKGAGSGPSAHRQQHRAAYRSRLGCGLGETGARGPGRTSGNPPGHRVRRRDQALGPAYGHGARPAPRNAPRPSPGGRRCRGGKAVRQAQGEATGSRMDPSLALNLRSASRASPQQPPARDRPASGPILPLAYCLLGALTLPAPNRIDFTHEGRPALTDTGIASPSASRPRALSVVSEARRWLYQALDLGG